MSRWVVSWTTKELSFSCYPSGEGHDDGRVTEDTAVEEVIIATDATYFPFLVFSPR